MTSVQIIANTGDLCGECPLWAASSQSLYWTDIAGRKVFHLAWPSGRHSMVLEDFEISGLAGAAVDFLGSQSDK